LTTRKQAYDVYLSLPTTGVVHAGELIILEENHSCRQVGFRYTKAYRSNPLSIALDPVALPLDGPREVEFTCNAGVPAFLDDYLPDDWGRKVLTRLSLVRDKERLNAKSVIDILHLLGGSRIGAISIVPAGDSPRYAFGYPLQRIADAEGAAQHVDSLGAATPNIDHFSLLHLANHGSGVGGARPKALMYDDDGYYLAKFNKISEVDAGHNIARIELACLDMARAAGINCGTGRVKEGINGREVLLLNRFDICTETEARHHLITVNGLLKSTETSADIGTTFRYDDICDLLRRHSTNIEDDLRQLVLVMLFNRAINNTDDHERNFSLINRGSGYVLSPAYDMVPSLVRGQYHAASFQYQPFPPSPGEAMSLKGIFGLNKSEVADCAEAVIDAVSSWEHFSADASVSSRECAQISKLLSTTRKN